MPRKNLFLIGITVAALAITFLANKLSQRSPTLPGEDGSLAQTGVGVPEGSGGWREDKSFGVVGKVVLALQSRRTIGNPARQTSRLYSLLVTHEGKVVAAGAVGGITESHQSYGEVFVTRLHGDGSLDLSFAEAGKRLLPIGPSDDACLGATLDTQGRILLTGVSLQHSALGGSAYYQPFIARLTASGNLDTSFNQRGYYLFPMAGAGGEARAIAVQSDGKILVVGSAWAGQRDRNIFVARLLPTGLPDTSFGSFGVRTLAVGPGQATGYDLALQTDGKILVGGSAEEGTVFTAKGPYAGKAFVVARLDARGSLDMSFAKRGFTKITPGPGMGGVTRLSLLGGGQLLAAGTFWDGSSTAFHVARILADGKLDTRFFDKGLHRTPLAAGVEFHSSALAVEPSGHWVGVGQSHHGFLVNRFLEDGSPDSTFRRRGQENTNTLVIPFSHRGGNSQAVALQADGKILAGGFFPEENQEFLALVRLRK